MNWKKMAGIIFALAVIAVVVFKLKDNKDTAESRVFHYDTSAPIHITADTIKRETFYADIKYTGTFEPYKEAKISAEQQGKIKRILVDEGSIVHHGQQLVQLDHSLLQLQLQSVDVEIEGLEKDVHRYTVLVQEDAIQGVQLEKAELGLKKATVQRASILEQIAKTTVKAPFDGIITAKFNEEGAFAAPGIPLLQVTQISQIKFTILVNEDELSRFDLNQSHIIAVDALPEIERMGKVVMIGSKANKGNRFPIQFLVQNTPGLDIKSGMFGKAFLTQHNSAKSIVVPSSSIVGSAHQPQVYLVKNGKAILQNITISERIKNKTIISDGINEGDLVVTSGFVNLYENAHVISE